MAHVIFDPNAKPPNVDPSVVSAGAPVHANHTPIVEPLTVDASAASFAAVRRRYSLSEVTDGFLARGGDDQRWTKRDVIAALDATAAYLAVNRERLAGCAEGRDLAALVRALHAEAHK